MGIARRQELVVCHDCGNALSFTAAACPHCGSRSAAAKLFRQLGIRAVATCTEASGPLQTAYVTAVDRLIQRHGEPHTILTLRTISESEGNKRALTEEIIGGVSDVILGHPRWANLGLEWLDAFDKIKLLEIRKIAKKAGARPLRAGIATLIAVELEKILGPSGVVAKTVKARAEPKQPRSITRVPEIARKISFGLELIALRSTNNSNSAFGRAVRARFNVDQRHASDCMRVARRYAGRSEIFSKLSWNALVQLSTPSLSTAARQGLEARIIAGERVGLPDVHRARGRLKKGRPKRAAVQSLMATQTSALAATENCPMIFRVDKRRESGGIC